MKRYALTKTVTYDLTAEVECEAESAEQLLDLIEVEGEGWIEWEQSDGNDEVIEAFEIEV